jgi:hypothetical protein
MMFGKGAYASLPFACRFQQENNVLVIQCEREAADLAACEDRADFAF